MKDRRETAWALLVVSDPGQADTLVDQRAWAQETARSNGWNLTKIFDGVSSGKQGARELTLAMIAELEALEAAQRPKRVLMIRIERLGRGDGMGALVAFLRLWTFGIIVHTRVDGDVTYGKASELLKPVLGLMLAGMENETRRDKLCTMYARRREARQADPTIATSMRPPYGLTYDRGRLVPKAPEDTAVRLAYELKGQGYGAHLIAKRLAHVAPPLALKNGRVCPQHWTSDRVRKLLLKETYRNTLVDDATWTRAQLRIRVVQRPTMHYEYPLGGALRCHCGTPLVGSSARRAHAPRFRYYQCRNMDRHGGGMKHYRADRLEERFADLLRGLHAEQALLRQYAESKNAEPQLQILEAQITSLRRELASSPQRRRTVHAAHEEGALTVEELRWRLDDLAARDAALTEKAEGLQHEIGLITAARLHLDDLRAVVRSAHEHWGNGPIDDRRALAKAIGTAFGGLIVA